MVFFPKSLSYLNPACMVEVDGNRTAEELEEEELD